MPLAHASASTPHASPRNTSPLPPTSRSLRRLATILAAILYFQLVPGEAEALRFVVTEVVPCPIDPTEGHRVCLGAEFTIGLRIEADPGEDLYGLGASAWGYDESVVDFVSGTAVGSIFHDVVIPGVGAFDGLVNTVGPSLAESSIGSSGSRVLFFNGVGLSPRNYNALDPGLDGVIGGGGTQLRLTFRGTGPGATVIRFGTGYNGDGAVYAGGRVDQSAGIVIGVGSDQSPVVPEPSSTLLLGLGLATLTIRRPIPRATPATGSRRGRGRRRRCAPHRRDGAESP